MKRIKLFFHGLLIGRTFHASWRKRFRVSWAAAWR